MVTPVTHESRPTETVNVNASKGLPAEGTLKDPVFEEEQKNSKERFEVEIEVKVHPPKNLSSAIFKDIEVFMNMQCALSFLI